VGQRQALETDNWVDTSEQLLENEPIRDALALFLVDRLYNSAEVEQRLEQVLPPRLQRLAGPAAAGLEEVARRQAPRALGTVVALRAWRNANRQAHSTLLSVVRSDASDRPISLDLEQLLAQVADATGLPQEAVDRLPPNLAKLQIADAEELDEAKGAVDLLEEIPWVLFGLALVAFAAAVYLSTERRRGVLNVGACLIVAGIGVLALRRLGEKAVVDALAEAPNADSVADNAWDIATSLVVDVAQGSMLLGLLIVSAAWLVGPTGWAAGTRRFAAPALRDHAGAVRAGLAVAILLLVIWGPVPWTTKVIPILLFTAAAFSWLEWTRARTLREFPAVA